jgi:hypothetical protein
MAAAMDASLAIEPKEMAPNVPSDVVQQDDTGMKEKTTNEKNDVEVETGSVDDAGKSYYSKLSVWLMILFSGLAIGSDG